MKDLLNLALDEAPAPSGPVDPLGDLERGRRLLRRRRMLGAAGVTSAMVIGALVPLALSSSGTPGSSSALAPHPAVTHATSSATRPSGTRASGTRASGTRASGTRASKSRPLASPEGSIALVAWTGAQPPGYRVSWMPSGWVVQGSNPYALTIAPANDGDTNPDSFLGKLVVMLQSADATSPPTGAAQPVNGRPGFFEPAAQAGGDTEILTFQVAGGKWVQVQAPMSLGWNSAELAKFASGVQVLVTAQPGHG